MNKKHLSWLVWICVLAGILFGIAVVSLSIGSVSIPFKKALELLLRPDNSIEYSILVDIRLPRILLGLAIGGALSVAGVLLQGMFRNPLVEPYTLGISGGAALGVSLNIVFGLNRFMGDMSLSVFGLAGALLVVFLVYSFSMKRGVLEIQGILLTGVMISFMSSALIMLIMAVSHTDDLHGIVFWVMGSLAEPDWIFIKLALIVSLVGLLAAYFFCFDLNGLSLGEEEARHIGINVERTKKYLFFIASLLTGMSVSVAGIIGFIGLVVPHFVRMFIGSDHRILLIGSYLAGALFLIFCDTLARTIVAPMELPVGVITGILGGALFIYALSKRPVALK
ncbi:MAG: iron ABC transporter permease [Elusimicrobiota bacterium]